MLLPASCAPKKDAPDRPGFLTRGVITRSRPSRDPKVQWLTGARQINVNAAAYSGGTVWAFHPLRVVAGASVKLSFDYNRLPSAPFFINIYKDFPAREETLRQ